MFSDLKEVMFMASFLNNQVVKIFGSILLRYIGL